MKMILVADDEKNIRALYKEMLENEGYKVILTETGQQTLNVLEMIKPDLVILDVKMPDISGMEILGEISKGEFNPPVLINSAYSGYIDDCRSWAAEDYIIKSSNTGELLMKVKEILGRKTQKDPVQEGVLQGG